MSAKQAILNKIRQQVAGNTNQEQRQEAVAQRLKSPPKGAIPKRGHLPLKKRVDLFCQKAEAVQATVSHIASYDHLAEAVSDYLRHHNLPQTIRLGQDTRLQNANWHDTPQLQRSIGPSDGTDPISLSHAIAGVAETGTLLLTSGADNPTTLNFLPENHIVVIQVSQIHGDYEAALDHIRQTYAKTLIPRTINMVTGPSRSADIEQTLLLGAHGPRALHIIVVTK